MAEASISHPRYSVIMPVLLKDDDHRQVVYNTLESVKKNSKDFEMIIVDDGSPLLTGFLRDFADVYIRHKDPKGIAPSWNDGIAVSRGEYVCIINDDILVPDSWLEFMKNSFENSDSGLLCGVSAPMVAGPSVVPSGLEAWHKEDQKFYPGFCFMLKRSVFLEKFDEQFVPYNGEDVDYWERITCKGLKMYRSPFAIWHKEGDVVHRLGDYETHSEMAIERFIKKHGFDPIAKFYS